MFGITGWTEGARGARRVGALLAIALVVGLLVGSPGLPRGVIPEGFSGRPGPEKPPLSGLATLERGWVENRGQWDARAAFSAPGYFGITWVTKDGELWHVFTRREECEAGEADGRKPPALGPLSPASCLAHSWVLAERWVGGKVTEIRGVEELPTQVSYFIGNDPQKHKSGLSSFREVSLGAVWEGVEVRLRANQKTVEQSALGCLGSISMTVPLKTIRRMRRAERSPAQESVLGARRYPATWPRTAVRSS
jgi:hypothetical protein